MPFNAFNNDLILGLILGAAAAFYISWIMLRPKAKRGKPKAKLSIQGDYLIYSELGEPRNIKRESVVPKYTINHSPAEESAASGISSIRLGHWETGE
jgi:hypothetical protein